MRMHVGRILLHVLLLGSVPSAGFGQCVDYAGSWEPAFDHLDDGTWDGYRPPTNPGTNPDFVCKTYYFEAIHMALIPKGPHQGEVLVVDWSFNGHENSGDLPNLGVHKQRWAIVKPGHSILGTSPCFHNGFLDLEAGPYSEPGRR
jgi:hypothetical protein